MAFSWSASSQPRRDRDVVSNVEAELVEIDEASNSFVNWCVVARFHRLNLSFSHVLICDKVQNDSFVQGLRALCCFRAVVMDVEAMNVYVFCYSSDADANVSAIARSRSIDLS